MHLMNSRSRFGLEGDKIFDYVTSEYIPVSKGFLDTPEGRWDLVKLAEFLRKGQFIEGALTPTTPNITGQSDKVVQANADFMAGQSSAVRRGGEIGRIQPPPRVLRTAIKPVVRPGPPVLAAPVAPQGEKPIEPSKE